MCISLEIKNNTRSCELNLCNCVKKPEKKKKFLTSTGFEPVTSRLSYEATDVGSRSIVGSYVPVKRDECE